MRTIRLKFRRSIIKRMKISVKNSQKRRSYVTLFLFAWMAHIAGAQGFTAGALTAFLYLAWIGAYDAFFLDWCRSGYFKRSKDMAGGFTEEQRNSIRKKLLEVGVSLSTSMGFKRMTVASVVKEAGVSVGSFYNFFSSKETFSVSMINELENRSFTDFMEKLDGVGTISVREFLHWYREYFRLETNFLLRLKLEDTIWLKSHIAGGSYFENGPDMERIPKIIPYVTGVRIDYDPGVVINFIKSIYASYQNRDPFFEEALQMNVDLIFEAIYRYVCLGH